MVKNKFKLSMLILIVLSTWVLSRDFKIDPTHANMGFSVKHIGVFKVRGIFKEFEGHLKTDKKGKLSELIGKIQVTSIDTGAVKRDDHLKNKDFFSAKKFPEITFEMVDYQGDNRQGTVIGNLTLRGVSKKIELDSTLSDVVKNPYGKKVMAVSLKGVINRKDFDVGKGFAAKTISDEVNINIEFEALMK